METGARYAVVGLFTLAVIAAGFGFVYWLHHAGGLVERATYQVQFVNSVSGLRAGSAVLFNGMRVGEVTGLQLLPANPQGVTAVIVVDRDTPVRADTQIGIEVQGLMGSPAIALRGGAPDAPKLPVGPGRYGVLKADTAASQDTMQTAREVLRHIDQVITENS
ncbi:MAG: MCE family protein, partial [Variibacter sp.]|nr:MCE family protein [Variibacter sp.]